jgi:radical SAM superfamily enzyme YgiQ (UPF0313 family)
MKIAICNPPLKGPGTPLLTQNRQFQWFRSPIASYSIYPVIQAYAATMLKKAGFEVFWLDGVAEKWSYQKWLKEVKRITPDLIVIESKTPVIKQHWKIINDLKKLKITNYPPKADQPLADKLKIVLVGDHVSALPEESLQNCAVDYILVGGDFDFRLLNLADYLKGRRTKLGSGIYLKDKKGKIVGTGADRRGYDLNKLPIIDRQLTKWRLYARGNSNFKYAPNAYTMIGRDCWWRRPSKDGKAGCTFCSWTSIFPTWRTGTPGKLFDEIDNLIKLGVKEVFDDTGTFPIGKWLEDFCKGMIERGLNKRIVFGCNMRAGALERKEFILMKNAGFRFILYGLESANQKTLDRINKGTTPEQLEQSLKFAKEAGLEPHVTIMFGYPWETKGDALKTYKFAKKLVDKGYINSLQATLLMPYPGTSLYGEAKEKGWLLTQDYDKYDMSQPVLKTPMTDEELKRIVRDCYHLVWSPKFILHTAASIKNPADLKHIGYQGIKYISKLLDFQSN